MSGPTQTSPQYGHTPQQLPAQRPPQPGQPYTEIRAKVLQVK